MNERLPEFQEEDGDAPDGGFGGGGGGDALPNGNLRAGAGPPMFPAVDELLTLFKESCKELVDLRQQVSALYFTRENFELNL